MVLPEVCTVTEGLECQNNTNEVLTQFKAYRNFLFTKHQKLGKFFDLWASTFLQNLLLMVNFQSQRSFQKLCFWHCTCSACSTPKALQIIWLLGVSVSQKSFMKTNIIPETSSLNAFDTSKQSFNTFNNIFHNRSFVQWNGSAAT